MQELFHDIKFYLSLDKDENSADFWRAMLIVCEDKISELDPSRTEQGVLAPRIAEDIAAKLSGKSYEELTLLQGQIQRKLGAGGAIDVDYWEALLKNLIVWKAKVCKITVLCSYTLRISISLTFCSCSDKIGETEHDPSSDLTETFGATQDAPAAGGREGKGRVGSCSGNAEPGC